MAVHRIFYYAYIKYLVRISIANIYKTRGDEVTASRTRYTLDKAYQCLLLRIGGVIYSPSLASITSSRRGFPSYIRHLLNLSHMCY